jgi:uncharacterized protein YdhG (YjbR/CyaY superfamily)
MNIFKPKTEKAVKEYISGLEADHQKILKDFYNAVSKTIPEITEGVSYGMPAFFYRGQPIASLMVTNKHYGFYPYGSRAIEEYRDLLREYSTSSGTIRFPLNKKLPVALIKKVVKRKASEIDENIQKKTGFPKTSNHAQRALENTGIKTLKSFRKYTEKEIANLHGMGPKAMGIFKKEMKRLGIEFKK